MHIILKRSHIPKNMHAKKNKKTSNRRKKIQTLHIVLTGRIDKLFIVFLANFRLVSQDLFTLLPISNLVTIIIAYLLFPTPKLLKAQRTGTIALLSLRWLVCIISKRGWTYSLSMTNFVSCHLSAFSSARRNFYPTSRAGKKKSQKRVASSFYEGAIPARAQAWFSRLSSFLDRQWVGHFPLVISWGIICANATLMSSSAVDVNKHAWPMVRSGRLFVSSLEHSVPGSTFQSYVNTQQELPQRFPCHQTRFFFFFPDSCYAFFRKPNLFWPKTDFSINRPPRWTPLPHTRISWTKHEKIK